MYELSGDTGWMGRNVDVSNNEHSGGGSDERLTATFSLPADMTGVAARVYVGFDTEDSVGSISLTAGDYFEAAEVQLEVGDTATPFEHRSYGDELARCQRYFETVYVWQQGHPTAIGQYVANSTGTYKATKRALPTLTEQVVTGGSSNGVTFGTFRNFELGGFGVQGISTKTGEIYRDTLVTADAEL